MAEQSQSQHEALSVAQSYSRNPKPSLLSRSGAQNTTSIRLPATTNSKSELQYKPDTNPFNQDDLSTITSEGNLEMLVSHDQKINNKSVQDKKLEPETRRELLEAANPLNYRHTSRKFEVQILKGETGFGFILGESEKGPIVKQIVDRSRCARLQVGDVLLKVNGEIVKKCPHAELVNVLKECPSGRKAVFLIHRQSEGGVPSKSQEVESARDWQMVSFDVKLLSQTSAFGFKIIGKAPQATIVREIERGGPADRHGRLIVGDEITHLNHQSIVSASEEQLVSMLKEAEAKKEMFLTVRRLVSSGRRDVVIEKSNSRNGFGFVLQSRSRTGCKIVHLKPGSPAEKCNQLYRNDQLLAINGQDVSTMKHKDIILLVKNSGLKIYLTVQCCKEAPLAEFVDKKSKKPQDDLTKNPLTISAETDKPAKIIEDVVEEVHQIDLQRHDGSFGFSIRGGIDLCIPLCVLKIARRGAAKMDGRLRRGDELVEINGISIAKMPHAEAVAIIRNGGDQVKLVVKRKVKVEPEKKDTMQLCNEAIKAGFVTVRITNVLLFGMAGTGKTSTKHLIFGLPPPRKRVSTPVAETPDRVLIRKIRDISGIRAQVTTEGSWKPVTVEDLKKLVVDIINYYSQNASKMREISEDLAKKLKQLPLPDTPELDPSEVASGGTASFSEECSDSTVAMSLGSQVNNSAIDSSTDTFLQYVSAIITEIQSMVAMEQTPIRELFGSNWIYFIDSGGQPHFHNLLPLFVQGISAALYVLRLSDRMDEYPLVEYYKDGRPIGEPFRSHLTTEDNFKFLVQSIQSRNEDCKLVCIGTHLDLIDSCSETEEEKNARLLEILPESICEKCHFDDVCGQRSKLIIPVNSIALGEDRNKMADKIRKVLMKCPCREIKVPVWWYNFEIIIEKICNEENQSVMSLDQCRIVAQRLNFHEDALIEALKFFHKHHIFHYYPDILPNVVFCDTQILLDKVTELVEHAAYLRDGKKTTAGLGNIIQFRDRGIITLKLLEEFEKHYVPGLFGPTELVEIFKHLLIAAPFDPSSEKPEFFMPSLLGILPAAEMSILVTQLLSNKSTPLIIQFRNGWPRCGVFCCLQVYLIKECGWSLGKLSGQNKPKQNIARMYLPNNPVTVTLIDSITYINVYVESTVSYLVCSRVRDNILSGLKSACNALHYDSEELELAFICPHSTANTRALDTASDISQMTEISALTNQSGCQHSYHLAIVLAESGWMRCTVCEDKCYRLQQKHKVWLAKLEKQTEYAPTPEEAEIDYSLEDLLKAYNTMTKCGVNLINAMSKDPRSLAAALFSRGLISQTTLERTIELVTETKQEKGSRLYNVVLNVVKSFPARFVDFINVLRFKRTLYGDILAEIDKMFVADTNL